MAAWKLPRKNTYTPEASPASPVSIGWTLLADLMLEILARSDISTLVHVAPACKLLPRDILSPSFIHRVTQQGSIMPPCILAYLNTHDDKANPLPPPFSLVHPATPTAASFLNGNLSRYLSRFPNYILGEHYPVTSRGGVILLCRLHIRSNLSDLCVHEPITGHRTFLSVPPGMGSNLTGCLDRRVLLTAADGINCSFLLFVPHLGTRSNNNNARTDKFLIATSARVTREPAIMSHDTSVFLLNHWFTLHRAAAVLPGGVIHWLVHNHGEIFTYNVYTTEQRTPHAHHQLQRRDLLGTYYSHDRRKLLRFLGVDGFKTSMWHQLRSGYWAPEAVTIDTEEKLRTLEPDIITGWPVQSEFKCSSEGSNAVFLRLYLCGPMRCCRVLITVVDLETMEMHVQELSTPASELLEVDLLSQLRSMKIFPLPDNSTP